MKNICFLIGYLGKDPELNYTQDKVAYAKVSLATTESVKRKEVWEKETSWHNLTIWGKQAEVFCKFLKKGSKIDVTGSIQYGKYEKDGITRYTTEIKVERFIFLDNKPTSDTPASEFTDENVPF